MGFKIIPILLLTFIFSGCKELEDYEPYENKKPKAPIIYNMEAIGLSEGSNVGTCILNIDIVELYKKNVSTNLYELYNDTSVEYIIDGEQQGGGSFYYDNYIDCRYDFNYFAKGLHDVVIRISHYNRNYNYNNDDLSSYFGYYGNEIIFKEKLYFENKPVGNIQITRAEIINDIAYIEWEVVSGAEPTMYRIHDRFDYEDEWEELLFGSHNSIQINRNTGDSRYLEIQYTNRSNSEIKTEEIYLR